MQRKFFPFFVGNDHIIQESRFSHTSEFDFRSRQVPDDAGAFCLSVTIADQDPGTFLPHINDFRVQRFAGSHTFFQAEFVSFEIFLDQHAQNGRRSTKRCDIKLLQVLELLCRIESSGLIECKNRCADIPRCENTAPRKFCPARLRYVVMNVSRFQADPRSGSQVSERITGMCMRDDFRHSGSSRSEKQEQCVI
ncbi:hypothetical protein D3C86_1646630 [compost metagenome]